MITQSMVFGPDQDGESIVVHVENGSVEHVVLQDANQRQIPFRELTKEHWLKMNEAEDLALERIAQAHIEAQINAQIDTQVEARTN